MSNNEKRIIAAGLLVTIAAGVLHYMGANAILAFVLNSLLARLALSVIEMHLSF